MRGGIGGKESKEKERRKGRKGKCRDRKVGIEEGVEGRWRMIQKRKGW